MQEFWVYLYIDNRYVKCARLTASEDGFELEYEKSYLEMDTLIDIDPQNLQAHPRKHTNEDLFASILDSAPDYWGRQLLNKKFNVAEMNELEYVLVNNLEHVGALAFSGIDDNGPLQLTAKGWRPHKKSTVDIEEIMDQTEMMIKDFDGAKLKELFEDGPTLGGGKPKVALVKDGKYYLAKYGISLDTLPEQQIEYAVMKMASDIGLNVPEIKIASHRGRNVFMIERFDRKLVNGELKRHHFVSSLSLCNWYVGDAREWSYPEFCELIMKRSSNSKEDLKELFKRIAFNIAVNNDDDHPRNHGLLCKDGEWRLSPLYDVFPKATISLETFRLAMTVGDYHREGSKRNLMSAIKYFDLDETEAGNIIDSINDF
ncbi:MAG: type II toxin-antitoxin system HipA family toxin, partial [Bacteriovoracaceae bacterium]|nr:type II toxin-antitoxin system HipA family toxin [Bacteriovoracaceae bacterium]